MDNSFWQGFRDHPIRHALARSAMQGVPVDEEELRSISAPAEILDQVRTTARELADASRTLGYAQRGQQHARAAADLKAERLIREIPKQFAHAVADDDEPEPADEPRELAARIRARQRYGITRAHGIDDGLR